jgi:glycosyltransferase involved in cell wall biosynthesis
LIAPIEVAGVASGLKAGFDRIGVDVELVFSQPHRFGYSSTSGRFTPRIWARLGAACFSQERKPTLLKLLIWKAWSVWVLAWALWRFDSFIFMFGNTITNSRFEPRLLSMLKRKVVMVYCGTDARPPYVDGQIFNDPKLNDPQTVIRLARKTAARVALHEKSGFTCINSPYTAQFHESRYVSWFAIGLPRLVPTAAKLKDAVSEQTGTRHGPVRILHSPSNSAVKGTSQILAALEEMKQRGYSFELSLLHDVSNETVLEEISKADLIIDQLYSDTPMASFAAEAAQFGKPILVAGYAASADLAELTRSPAPPTMFVQPDEIASALESLLSEPGLRGRLGQEAYAFAQGPWSPEAVAQRYMRLLEGEPPPEWLISPEDVYYVHGCGLSEADAQKFVRQIVTAGGASALQLDHKPTLRDAFLAFAAAGDPRDLQTQQ